MVTGRSEQRRHEEMIELGEKNVECIRGLTSWCKHSRIKMVSAGMLAEMSGLPIGSHAVSCPHAMHGSESMNLPWIVPEFIVTNCVECKFHQPNGNTAWAENVIQQAAARRAEQVTCEENRSIRFAELRNELQKIPRQAIATAETTQRSVLEYGEQLFSSNVDASRESLRRLQEAARVGPELFAPVLINLVLEQTQTPEFGEVCLQLCAELAPERPDLASEFSNAAISAIANAMSQETAASIILRLDPHISYPLSNETIDGLVAFQEYYRPVGGWRGGEPEYPSSIGVLQRCYEARTDAVLSALRRKLQINNKRVRVNVCGVIKRLQDRKPEIGMALLPDLVESLKLDDDMYESSADGAACSRIAECFYREWQRVDDYLAARIMSASGELQAVMLKPYWMVLLDRHRETDDETANCRKIDDECVACAYRRCLEVARCDDAEIETRREAAEALQAGSASHPEIASRFSDSLLGTLALLSQQATPPPSRPRILVPGAPPPMAGLAQLQNANRQFEWQHFKTFFQRSLEELAESRPQLLCDSILKSLAALNSKDNPDFKGALIEILGKVGADYGCQPLVLPTLMNALMDYDSVLVRATAISATKEAFRSSRSELPSNVLDVLVIHLRDRYVAIHRTAIRAIRQFAYQLNDQQAAEAMDSLDALAAAYSNKPYEVDDICDAIFSVARRNKTLRLVGLRVFASIFPTREQLVDEKLVERLLQLVNPDAADAAFAVLCISNCLTDYERDKYNSFDHQQHARFFEWLHSIPQATFTTTREVLLTAARAVAKRDPWEACHFCSLFVRFNDHIAEQEILRTAKAATEGEKSEERFGTLLQNLAHAAAANSCKFAGQKDEAEAELRQIVRTLDEKV